VLLHAIHSCAVRFPDIASSVVLTLMEYLGDANAHSASDVISFVREVVEKNPNNSRGEILAKLTQSLASIRAARVFRAALWILGQYATESSQVDQAFTAIKDVLGEPPFVPATAEDGSAPPTDGKADQKKQTPAASPAPAAPRRSQLLLPDGSYATQSAVSELAAIQQKEGTATASDRKPLRTLLLSGDFFLGTALAGTLVKLVRKKRERRAKHRERNREKGIPRREKRKKKRRKKERDNVASFCLLPFSLPSLNPFPLRFCVRVSSAASRLL
jgi:coatomer subunit beta